jgi:hypothetical protein
MVLHGLVGSNDLRGSLIACANDVDMYPKAKLYNYIEAIHTHSSKNICFTLSSAIFSYGSLKFRL